MGYKAITCPKCGESHLHVEGDLFVCEVCESTFTKEEESSLEEKLEQYRQMNQEIDLGHLRYLIRNELKKNIRDYKLLLSYVLDVLKVLPEDFQALYFKHLCNYKRHPNAYDLFLVENKNTKLSKYEKEFLYHFIIDECQYRSLNSVVEFLQGQNDYVSQKERLDKAMKQRELESDFFAGIQWVDGAFKDASEESIDRIFREIGETEEKENADIKPEPKVDSEEYTKDFLFLFDNEIKIDEDLQAGLDLIKNPNKVEAGLRLINKSARTGTTKGKSYFEVGRIIREGIPGLDANPEEARKYFDAAMEQFENSDQDSLDLRDMGDYYNYGLGNPPIDKNKALFYYESAAAKGDEISAQRAVEIRAQLAKQ